MKFKNTQCCRFAILEIRNIPENWNLCKLDSEWFKLIKPISKLHPLPSYVKLLLHDTLKVNVQEHLWKYVLI